MGRNHLHGIVMQNRAGFDGTRLDVARRGSNDGKAGGKDALAGPRHGVVGGGSIQSVVPGGSRGAAGAGYGHLLRISSRVHDLSPNGIGSVRRPGRRSLRIGEFRFGRDDRGAGEWTDAGGRVGTQRQRNVGLDMDRAAFYYYRAGQLDRIVAGSGHGQYESVLNGADGRRRREQPGFDFSLQFETGIVGVVRSRFYRHLVRAGVESDAERLTRQLELISSADYIAAEFSRGLIDDRSGGAGRHQVSRGGEAGYYRCRYGDRAHV